jgi:hypothetical protein
MTRAILALSGPATRPLTLFGGFFSALWREFTRDALRSYRPERHYMRGPGPAWHAKHGGFPRA